MKISIRNVKPLDIDAVEAIENQCFPVSEAADRESLQDRIAAFPENFLVADIDRALVGFINGCTTNSPVIYDEMFHGVEHHVASGQNLAIFGLDVIPEYRRQGIAAQLMKVFLENARNAGKKNVILTCKDHLIHYYEGFGFVNNGISESQHGGATWYDMTCTL